MVKEAIILAGGLGTRLRDAVPDLPKCMAPVAGQPFLTYVIRHLLQQGIERFIFSLGYKHEVIAAWLEQTFPTLDITCVVESTPLGTGGAIRLSLDAALSENVFIVNGDTLFRADLDAMENFHFSKKADCTIALKTMEDTSRYGIVTTAGDGRIMGFDEKKPGQRGQINGGIYLLDKRQFLAQTQPGVFSFERDYLEPASSSQKLSGYTSDGYFIDIGIPEDYRKAQHDLARQPFRPGDIDSTWTLFLDRDGVINVNNDDGYILDRSGFVFTPNALEALKILGQKFGKIIVVTNQRGVSKGLMTENDLVDIHRYMTDAITAYGGRLDDIFYCTAIDDRHQDRKPNPGMARKARRKFPEIDFSRSVMVGDKLSDMEWGRNIGARTVLVGKAGENLAPDDDRVDLKCANLWETALKLTAGPNKPGTRFAQP